MKSLLGLNRDVLYDRLLNLVDSGTADQEDYSKKYQDDPVRFCEEVLKETLTDDVKILMESVRDHTITVAKSANAVGKTHAAGGLAVWAYKCFPNAQVYTAAAPPEANLKKYYGLRLVTGLSLTLIFLKTISKWF